MFACLFVRQKNNKFIFIFNYLINRLLKPTNHFNIEENAKRGRRKSAKMVLVQRTCKSSINPALQSINLGKTVSYESQNEVQNVN